MPLLQVYNGCTPPKPPGAPDVPGPPPYNQAGMFPRVLASLFPSFCNGLAAHADFGIAGAVVPPESWATTLLVTVLREPVARTISSFYFRQKFCRHALAQPDCDYDFSGNETQASAWSCTVGRVAGLHWPSGWSCTLERVAGLHWASAWSCTMGRG